MEETKDPPQAPAAASAKEEVSNKEGAEAKKESAGKSVCNEEDDIGPAEEAEVASQNTTCLKTLTNGHKAFQAKLQQALSEQAIKEKLFYELENDIETKQEKIRILQDGLQVLNEKLFCLKTELNQKEKRQEGLFLEIAELKWRLKQAKSFVETVAKNDDDANTELAKRKDEFGKQEDVDDKFNNARKEAEEYNSKLENYKKGLKDGDLKLQSILNGSKLMELEQRKRALHDAFDDREARCGSLYLEIDEKNVQIEQQKKSLDDLKEQCESQTEQLSSQLQCLRETEQRLQRSVDYLRQKIDYGMYVPAPPPWPNFRKQD